VTTTSQAERGGTADVIYVLCLLQAGFLLLAGIGETLLMGNGLYLIIPIAKMALLFVLAAKAAAGRRWALIVLVVVQGVTVLGFWVQVAVGLTPWVDFTVNLAVLITNFALPGVLVYLCATQLRRKVAYALPAAQDPFAPAPLVTRAMPPDPAPRMPPDTAPRVPAGVRPTGGPR
jgi:hypothetical protein